MKSKCQNCYKDKELEYCKLCFNKIVMERISESVQGDISERIKFILDVKFEEIEEKIMIAISDKYFIGKKIKNNIKLQSGDTK